MSFDDSNILYKHSIIQFAQALLNKYFLGTDSKNSDLNEASIYAFLFGKVAGISSNKLNEILRNVGDSRNPLITYIKNDLIGQLSNNDLKLTDSFGKKLSNYLISIYDGRIDESRVKSLIGDIFIVSLVEIVYDISDSTHKILNTSLLHKLQMNKENTFLCELLELIESKGIKFQVPHQGNGFQAVTKMASALAQYLEYDTIRRQAEDHKSSGSDIDYIESLNRHLMLIKEFSNDVYSFIEEEVSPFRPSEMVFIKYFYIAAMLIKTDYDKSMAINYLYATKFIKEELRDNAPFRKLIEGEVSNKLKNITDPDDDLNKLLKKIFNPLGSLMRPIGIIGSWILWDFIILIFVILGINHLINYSALNLVIPYTEFIIQGRTITFLLSIYLSLSLLVLFYKVLVMRKNIVS